MAGSRTVDAIRYRDSDINEQPHQDITSTVPTRDNQGGDDGDMADKEYWIGFDLGGTKMLATVFDANFRPVGRQRKRTKGYDGAEAGVKRIVQTILGALEDADVNLKNVAGVGIGCPGPVDLKRGVIVEAANLGWNEVPLQQLLEKELGCSVAVLNDVDAGVYGEYRLGAAKGARCAIWCFSRHRYRRRVRL